MTLREALVQALIDYGLRDRDLPLDQLYPDDWFRVRFGARRIRLFRIGPMMDSLALHDAHHLITGYGTDWRGEAEIAAWELASGGCSTRWLMCLDRLSVLPLIALTPKRCWTAAKRGWRSRNLYRMSTARALAMELEEARRHINR